MKRFAIQCLIALLVQIACWSGLAHAARAIDVAAGNAHSLQLRDDGTVWAWGMNQNGNASCG